MNTMVTRREFTKSIGGAVALAALTPVVGWGADAPKISAEAAKLYRDSFILDGNALASIGWLRTRENQDELTKAIRESGVNAVKATLGGATGDFAMTVEDISMTDQLMEKRADLFIQIRVVADFDPAITIAAVGAAAEQRRARERARGKQR